jgi:hypothetical protein
MKPRGRIEWGNPHPVRFGPVEQKLLGDVSFEHDVSVAYVIRLCVKACLPSLRRKRLPVLGKREAADK